MPVFEPLISSKYPDNKINIISVKMPFLIENDLTKLNIIEIVAKAPRDETFRKNPLCLPYDSSKSRVWIKSEIPKISPIVSK